MRPDHALKGIAMVVAATFLFGLADTVSKHLAILYAVPVVLAARYVVNLALLAVVMGPRHGASLWRANRLGLMVVRGLCLAAASLSMVFALRVMLLAGRFLGEEVHLTGWIAAGCSFVGMLPIVRPGSGLDPEGVALCIFNAAFATVYHLLTRVLTRTETTMAMLFHTALVGTEVFVALLPWSLDGAMPGWVDAGLMVALGALATVGHLMFTAACRQALASLLAPVNYLHIVFAAVLGGLVFGHVPDALAMAAMALAVVSGVAVTLSAQGKAPA